MITERSPEFLKRMGLETWGANNQPPQPLTECNVSEFWSMFSQYGVRENEFRQMHLGEKYVENAHILIYHDKVIVVKVKQVNENGKYISVPTVYRAGCIHEYDSVILNSRRGDLQYTCKKCEYSYKDNCGD